MAPKEPLTASTVFNSMVCDVETTAIKLSDIPFEPRPLC